MSTNSSATAPPSATPDVSVIENEIPAYRALSPVSIVSLLLGLASVLCFADVTFYILPVLAIVTGAWAIRKIHRLPDVLVGVQLAQFGIVLAVLFTISSITVTVVQDNLRLRGAQTFARQYVKTLNTQNLADALWYKVPPSGRRGVSSRDALEAYRKQKSSASAGEDHAAAIVLLHEKLKGPPARKLEFVEIEVHGLDRLTPLALAVAKLSGTTDQTKPGEGYCAINLKAMEGDVRPVAWFVEDVKYPYVPKSYVAKVAPIDDGHGHGH